jgi:hypothetical protein
MARPRSRGAPGMAQESVLSRTLTGPLLLAGRKDSAPQGGALKLSIALSFHG